PSPSSPYVFQAGSFGLRWYGLLIAIGIAVAIWIARREFRRRGWDPEGVYTLAMWAVPAGIIGARLYHVATDWHLFADDPARIIQIQQGGLGLPGVIIGGAIGAMIAARRLGLPALGVFDCVAPGLILAQALGRWGNWFNQELFGGPSNLPWAVEIDPQFRPANYLDVSTFQPTFLYESLWNLGVFAVLMLLVIPRFWNRARYGTVFAAYLLLYGIGRLWVEALRVDPAHVILGVRLNDWVFGIVVILAAAFLARSFSRLQPAPDALLSQKE
ncbi:MAG: prolipoprotein diacylglyceryl transferase, partial [Actinobacteria bacterium]|nr:prolipoprotein diacylglyceryl transferase [Actinomycetota bacterium]